MVVILLLYCYFVIGFVIAVWFCFIKLPKIDVAAAGSSFWFRLLIIPGTVLLWPLVWYTLSTSKKLPIEL